MISPFLRNSHRVCYPLYIYLLDLCPALDAANTASSRLHLLFSHTSFARSPSLLLPISLSHINQVSPNNLEFANIAKHHYLSPPTSLVSLNPDPTITLLPPLSSLDNSSFGSGQGSEQGNTSALESSFHRHDSQPSLSSLTSRDNISPLQRPLDLHRLTLVPTQSREDNR